MDVTTLELIIFFALGSIIVSVFLFLWLRKPPVLPTLPPEPKKKQINQKKLQPNKPKKEKIERHPLCELEVRHSKESIDSVSIDPKGHFLATTSEDKSIRLYPLENIYTDRKVYKIPVEGDYPTRSCLSSDGHYFITALRDSKEIYAYKIAIMSQTKGEKKSQALELVRKFPNKHSKSDNITNVQLSSNLQFLLSCGNDTIINLWNLKGEILSSINTKQMKNNMACISPDSRFISAATFVNDVRLWRVNTTKEGRFVSVQEPHFTQLRGHKSTVYWVSFTSDSKKVVTSSKDCTWKLWNIDVDYSREEEPQVILSRDNPTKGTSYNMHSISPDNTILAAICGRSLHFWNLNNGDLLDTIDKVHTGTITDLCWYPDSSKLVTSSTDTAYRIFKNPLK